jgi:type IVB pilus formation R64 PilN family outer membrane protein
MKLPSKSVIGLGLVSTLALSACAGDISSGAIDRKTVSNNIDAAQSDVDHASEQLFGVSANGRPANIRVRDGIWLGKDGFRSTRGDPLPKRFETPDGISVWFADEVEFADVAYEIERLTGIRVDMTDILHAPSASAGDSKGEASTADSTGAGGESNAFDDPEAGEESLRVQYSGRLSGLLDLVASSNGYDWEYRGRTIRFLAPKTVTYTLWAQSSATSVDSSIGGGNSAVFGGAMPATTSSKIEIAGWDGIEEGLKSIIPTEVASYSMNESSGTITVTGFQATHERVARFVEQENARLSRQVAVKVDIIAYSQDRSDKRSANLQLAFDRAAAGLAFDMTSSPNLINGSAGFGTTILNKDSGPLKNFTGSEAIINALSEQGRVSLLRSTSVIALNNSPTPVSIANEKAYLSGAVTTATDDGESTTLETGIISSGLNLVITPRILSSGSVMMNYTMNITELKGIEEFEAEDGGSRVMLPEVETRNFMQNLNIDSGSTIVVASFDQSTRGENTSGPFDPRMWGLGGANGFDAEDTRIVVMMTPVVLESQNQPKARR